MLNCAVINNQSIIVSFLQFNRQCRSITWDKFSCGILFVLSRHNQPVETAIEQIKGKNSPARLSE